MALLDGYKLCGTHPCLDGILVGVLAVLLLYGLGIALVLGG